MKRLLIVAVLLAVAVPVVGQSRQRRRAAIINAVPPPAQVCGNQITEPPETCDNDPAPPTSGDGCSATCQLEGTLAGSTWTPIPNSEMNNYKNTLPGPQFAVPPGGWHSTIDDQPDWGANDSWENIMEAESGGVCMGSTLYVWGGGHHDGAHNGVMALDTITGVWSRLTPPTSDVWDGGCCPIVGGQFYSTNPNGSPAARHTYNLITGDPTGASPYIYAVGGGIWPGSVGGERSPTSWVLDINGAAADGPPMWGWRNFADSPAAHAHGNMIWVDNKLYTMTADSSSIYDIATGIWTPGGSRTIVSGSTMVYSPVGDKFYVAGDGLFYKIPRATFQTTSTRTNLTPFGTITSSENFGAIYYPPEQKVIYYDSGRPGTPPVSNQLMVIDPVDDSTSIITPAGQPGTPTFESYGRFAYCGNRVILVGGFNQPMYYLKLAEPPPSAVCGNQIVEVGEQCDNDPAPPTDGDGCSATCQIEVPDPPEPPGELIPRLATPPGGSLAAFDAWVDADCGLPRAQWPVIDVGPGQPFTTTANLPVGQTAVIRIHWSATKYPTLAIKEKKCIEVIGISDGPNGPAQRLPQGTWINQPIISNINAASIGFSKGDPIKAGGLIVRNISVDLTVNSSCIIPPSSRRFFAVEDSSLTRCTQHGFLTTPSNQEMYVRVFRSYFSKCGVHCLYIDHVGRTDIIDNVCESPGNNHCIRSVALVNHLENNLASNVQLDGTRIVKPGTLDDVPPGVCHGAITDPNNPSEQCSIGMNPIEVYSCQDSTVLNNTAIKYEANQAAGGFNLRSRQDISSCDIEGKTPDGLNWIRLHPVTDARYQSPAFWAEVSADLDANMAADRNNSRFAFNSYWEGNTIKTIGPTKNTHAMGVAVDSVYPGLDPDSGIKARLKNFVTANPGKTCAELSALTTDLQLKWLFDHVVPDKENTVCTQGVTTTYNPAPAPDNWRERQFMTWGPGNSLLICPGNDPAVCDLAPSTRPDINNNTRERQYFHPPFPQPPGMGCAVQPGQDFNVVCRDKAVGIFNLGGAVVFYVAADDEVP